MSEQRHKTRWSCPACGYRTTRQRFTCRRCGALRPPAAAPEPVPSEAGTPPPAASPPRDESVDRPPATDGTAEGAFRVPVVPDLRQGYKSPFMAPVIALGLFLALMCADELAKTSDRWVSPPFVVIVVGLALWRLARLFPLSEKPGCLGSGALGCGLLVYAAVLVIGGVLFWRFLNDPLGR